MQTQPLHRTIEECSLNAWPSLIQRIRDGWLIRLANGFTRRSNSVHPIYPGAEDVLEKIAYCEQVYQQRAQPCIFKITPLAEPSGLDGILADRGYLREGETIVQVLDDLPEGSIGSPGLRLELPAGEDWSEAFIQWDKTPPEFQDTLRAIIGKIPPSHAGAILTVKGEPASCGRGVIDREQIGLFDIATDPEQRRGGLAGRLIDGLLAWGAAKGAERAYLQVEADNTPALKLYQKMGFKELYRYWYRVYG